MKARGVRLHAANDLRLEEFELPELTNVRFWEQSTREYMRMLQSIRPSWDMNLQVIL